MFALTALVVGMVLASLASQLVLKTFLNSVGPIPLQWSAIGRFLWRAAFSPEIIAGILLYGLGFAIWIIVLTRANLSMVYPMATGLLIVLSVTASAVLLHESLAPTHLIGIALILAGIFLIFA